MAGLAAAVAGMVSVLMQMMFMMLFLTMMMRLMTMMVGLFGARGASSVLDPSAVEVTVSGIEVEGAEPPMVAFVDIKFRFTRDAAAASALAWCSAAYSLSGERLSEPTCGASYDCFSLSAPCGAVITPGGGPCGFSLGCFGCTYDAELSSRLGMPVWRCKAGTVATVRVPLSIQSAGYVPYNTVACVNGRCAAVRLWYDAASGEARYAYRIFTIDMESLMRSCCSGGQCDLSCLAARLVEAAREHGIDLKA